MDLQRISTGIAGLDLLLQGGFIKGRSYLVTGDSGTGKTVACLQFLRNALKHGEKAVYVTVDERPGEILESAASFSWDFQPDIQEKKLLILDAAPYFSARSGNASEKGIDPQKIVADLGSYAKRMAATLLIIDPITPLILPTDAAGASQDQARSLMQLIQTHLNTTNLFTAHLAKTVGAAEQFLTAGVLVLEMRDLNGKFARTLTVKKMRGTAVIPASYPFTIAQSEGIVLSGDPTVVGSCAFVEPRMFEFFELKKKI
jgi:circadian clock protein KaiC